MRQRVVVRALMGHARYGAVGIALHFSFLIRYIQKMSMKRNYYHCLWMTKTTPPSASSTPMIRSHWARSHFLLGVFGTGVGSGAWGELGLAGGSTGACDMTGMRLRHKQNQQHIFLKKYIYS